MSSGNKQITIQIINSNNIAKIAMGIETIINKKIHFTKNCDTFDINVTDDQCCDISDFLQEYTATNEINIIKLLPITAEKAVENNEVIAEEAVENNEVIAEEAVENNEVIAEEAVENNEVIAEEADANNVINNDSSSENSEDNDDNCSDNDAALLTIDDITITGSILDATEEYICYQANGCGSDKTICGLTAEIIAKYPYANVYETRKYNPNNEKYAHDDWIVLPEKVCEMSSDNGPTILAMIAQFTPGEPFNYKHHKSVVQLDSYELRESWFKECLCIIGEMEGVRNIAFPWKIGCSRYSKGNWDKYSQAIVDFANKNRNITVRIYKPQ